MYRLRRYFPDAARPGPPVAAGAADDARGRGLRRLAGVERGRGPAEHGVDPWVVDFGAPEHEEGGLERTLADHVVAVSEPSTGCASATGADVHLGGYSQGGMFCYQAAAYRRGEGIDSVVTFGSPVDTRGALPFGIPEEVAESAARRARRACFGAPRVPAWASRTGFRLLDPVKSLRQRVDFVRQLHDREALLPRERQRRFLQGEGWVAWPGPAIADFMRQFVAHNRMLAGRLRDRGPHRHAGRHRPPGAVLRRRGRRDRAAAAPCGRSAAPRRARRSTRSRCAPGTSASSSARRRRATTWPTVAAWTRWRDGRGTSCPTSIRPVAEDEPEPPAPGSGPGSASGSSSRPGSARGVARSLVGAAVARGRRRPGARRGGPASCRAWPASGGCSRGPASRSGCCSTSRPRARPTTPSSCSRTAPTPTPPPSAASTTSCAGLISLGVRQGEHVGVLMGTRPSGLTVVAALNRLGAVAVLLRPDGAVAREAELGQVTPDRRRPRARRAARSEAGARGGARARRRRRGARPRLAGSSTWSGSIPTRSSCRPGTRPTPAAPRDLAFVLFTGEGERTRANRITNGRWALSAFGTASAAALSDADTVYAVTPIHHPSGLLMSIGGAIARRRPARAWRATSTRRRSGTRSAATGSRSSPTPGRCCTSSSTRPTTRPSTTTRCACSSAPGCRAGCGGGSRERFAPARGARVLRLDRGRGGPRQPERREARLQGPAAAGQRRGPARRLRRRRRPPARARRRLRDRVRAGRGRDAAHPRCAAWSSSSESPLRGVFEPDDAWLATGDLFRADEDGDFWLVDHAAALIRTAHGHVGSFPIVDALGDLDAVDLAVVYGVDDPDSEHQLAVAAVTLRDGAELDPAALGEALSVLTDGRAARPRPRRRRDPGDDLVPAQHRLAASGGRALGPACLAPSRRRLRVIRRPLRSGAAASRRARAAARPGTRPGR